jgi:2-oxo-3-hexenedioate decarboxylase
MDQHANHETLDAIAAEAFDALTQTRQVSPFSSRSHGLSIEDAYRVTPRVRQRFEARGARFAGRKIGFTNRTIWDHYKVYAPIWGYAYDRTVHDLAITPTLSLRPFSEPLIEPEIMFGLGSAPSAGMDEVELSGCIDWVAFGYEIVQSIYPGWKFAAGDTIAAGGMHGALMVGPRRPFAPRAAEWRRELTAFELELSCDGQVVDRGRATNVLEGPLSALRHLVELLEHDPVNPPLASGEIISTGTLTKAMPIAPGQTWTAKLSGIALDGAAVGFV